MNFVEWSDTKKVLERSSQSIWGETIKQTVRTEQEINKPLKENMEQFFRKKEQATQQAKKKKICDSNICMTRGTG